MQTKNCLPFQKRLCADILTILLFKPIGKNVHLLLNRSLVHKLYFHIFVTQFIMKMETL